MTAYMLDGTKIARDIKSDVATQAKELEHAPQLAVILVGDDPASKIYVQKKQEACDECGFESFVCYVSAIATTEALIDVVHRLNNNPEISGILVQLPLPSHIDKFAVLNEIDPAKDVDCFTPTNLGLLAQNRAILEPCTPQAVIEILKRYNLSPAGKRVAIVNRSLVVGQPLATMLMRENEWGNATVTVCHDRTENFQYHTANADFVITAVGKPDVYRLRGNMIRGDAVVIDVGISRMNGKIIGDATEDVADFASYLTPCPGGVGPVTCAILMRNTLIAARSQLE
jgi:methylenetetrahydrofolate dehydrogenase (NADP+)/methenyltetrahydrofolate cyclohydrolase